MEDGSVRSYGEESTEEAMRVTRSIMIVKPPGYQIGSPPVSPAGSTPPLSPFSGKVVNSFRLSIYLKWLISKLLQGSVTFPWLKMERMIRNCGKG